MSHGSRVWPGLSPNARRPTRRAWFLRFNCAGHEALEVKPGMPFSRASSPAKAEPDTFPRSSSDEEPGSSPTFVALDRSREFWTVIGYAVVFGLVLAFAGLAFLGLVKGGTKLWFTLPKNPDWFSGSPWWVAVTAAAGVLVGVLRRVLQLSAKLPGTMKELRDERVEPSTVLKAVAVSLVSLVGGASLGPEDALGKIGGGLGTWASERRKLDKSTSATNALSGMSGAYAGLLSSPILATSFVVEIARPKRAGFANTVVAALRGHRVHRRTGPRDAVHRRDGWNRRPLADPWAP